MLAAYAVIGGFGLLGLGIFFVAVRGGPRGARAALQSQSRGGRRTAVIVFAVLYLGIGAGIPILLLAGNHRNASAQVGGSRLTAADRRGREIFGTTCGTCHTLAAANAVGTVGPNLDKLRPTKLIVVNAVTKGLLRGNGTMPAGLLTTTSDINAVADFVSKTAGR